MSSKPHTNLIRSAVRAALLPAMGLLNIAAAGPALAQTAPADSSGAQPAAGDSQQVEEVVVTGIRRSIEDATNAKRESITFGDSIYAEDIGKLPATNLAETLNRIPGVQLNRDIDGEGVQVAIRGLGPSFSKVLLNGSQFEVASDGGTNGGSTNREVDLDFFPSELFTRLDVQKSPVASTVEGGIAGTVNLQNARPFDKPGQHLTVIGQAQYQDSDGQVSPRGALIGSKTWDTFGVLLGVSGVKAKTRIDGFESIGWTDGNVSCAGCNSAANMDTGNGFSYASVYPNNVGFGLTPGAPVDLAKTSGLPIQTISTAKIPRLGRNSLTVGDRERVSTLLSMEFRPTDTLRFALDSMYAKSIREYERFNMNWYVRNSGPGTSPTSTGGMVPIDVSVDPNHIVTSGTFANSSFFLENDVFNQTTKFWNINPSMRWEPRDRVRLDAQLNYGRSNFFREQPQFDFQTPAQSGVTVFYQNTGGDQPVITSNRNLDDPNLGWRWYRVNVSNVKRTADTKGAHVDLTLGDDKENLRTGLAYDDASRTIRAYDNSTAFQTSVCGATCDGTTGSILNSQVANYLVPMNISNFGHLAPGNVGYTQWIMTNLNALERVTNYAHYRDTAPETRGAVTGGPTGDNEEKVAGAYVEANKTMPVLDRDLHINLGVRYAHTDQRVTAPVQVATGLFDQTKTAGYGDFLPSLNTVWDVRHDVKVRFSVSRTMTRPDPGQSLPGMTFSDPSAQIASKGNPDLKPYTSTNFDIGGEWYTGGSGYIGLALFRKDIDGFTVNTQTTVPFTALGINFTDLTTTQQQAITGRGGPGVAVVTVTQPINLQTLQLQGAELTWVQPLDFLVKGLGFQANGTRLTQSSDSGLFAPGVAPWSYNIQTYYENYGVSVSLDYVWNDQEVTANPPQNNIAVPLRADAHGQLDLSANYALPFWDSKVRVTVDALNLTNSALRTTFGYSNATYSVYYPGREVLLGFRATF
jgi:TonB-dependent receptor